MADRPGAEAVSGTRTGRDRHRRRRAGLRLAAMARLTLVRHGEAAAGWGEHHDPGLSELGRSQAEAVAEALTPVGPLPIVVSPLRRTRETAKPLALRWGVDPQVEDLVGEIATPDGVDDRSTWLAGVLAGRWSEQAPELRSWADAVVDRLLAQTEDAVVVSHFVAINVAIGRATGDDRVVCVRVGNCSRTVVDNAGGRLALVDAPVEVDRTDVL